ncbi:VIT1/CCC1 transporter family protein [Sphaerisporangium perillae]|uniref:VIT1/CCC1 transporter family protein n=1 Tax=Sphaerisporangium perillae TaxID=2935860 RepID=UPI00200D0EB9|nr:VIT1/CCC1 transporter family protein [Sphaerisporangium perillae]
MSAETHDTDIQHHTPPADRRAAARFRDALDSERQSAALYRGLAAGATGERQQVFLQLAAIEERHAAHWADKLTGLGEPVPEPGRSGLRTRLLSWLARRYSVDAVLPIVERAEHADAGLYDGDPDALPSMAVDERSHARVLTRLRARDTGAEPGGPGIARRERWHRSDRSGTLRAAVFGVNDGLVSNTSLAMGFAGSGASGRTILFAGLAGLLAGAFSMAAGEYISMRSQRESYEREIALESEELRDDPEAEAEELALIYRAKGLDEEEAQRVATTIMKDHDAALETMAREELGLDPGELGSPWSAALSSLIAFALGAVVVVIPYLFGSGTAALVTAVILAAASLFAVGAVLGLLNGRAPLRGGARQLLIGGGAAVVVYLIGHAIGTGGV